MQEIDEKLESVYEAIRKERERLTADMDKSERRSKEFVIERFERLKELIDKGNTLRSNQINVELSRLQKTSDDCVANCTTHKKSVDERLKSLENWKLTNWQRLLVYLAVSAVAAVKVIEWFLHLVHNQ